MREFVSILIVAALVLAAGPWTGARGESKTPSKKAARVKSDACYKHGESVTVQGRAPRYVNGGMTLFLTNPKSLCVHYPNPSSRAQQTRLEIVGPRIPTDRYIEVIGELADAYPIYGVGIAVRTVKDIDTQVRAEIEARISSCRAWRDAHRAFVRQKGNGGEPGIPGVDADDGTSNCCLVATNPAMPHNMVGMCREKGAKINFGGPGVEMLPADPDT